MKKIVSIIIGIINLIICFNVNVSASDQKLECGFYDLNGKRQDVARFYVFDFLTKDGNECELFQQEKIPSEIDVSENILSKANENERFMIIDLKSDSEENPYPEIEKTSASISLPQSTAGAGNLIGKDYRLFFAENDTSKLTDITDRIINSSSWNVSLEIEELGTYVLYFNPAVYGVAFYSEGPMYDDNGNMTSPGVIYERIHDLNRHDIIKFPPIPEKEDYVFTGWKAWSGIIFSYVAPQPKYAVHHSTYYATWCPEDEYEPIKVEISSDSITKGKEDGSKILLKTNYGIFSDDCEINEDWITAYEEETNEKYKAEILSYWKSKWNVVGSDDILIKSVQRIDDKTVELTLSGNSRDIYTDGEIYVEFDCSLLRPEPYEKDGEIIDWDDTKIQMDSDGVRKQMYSSDNAVALNKQSRPRSGGGGGGSASYTVKFDTNGGSEVKSQSIRRNTALAKPGTPVKDGFEFAGWYKDKELTQEYDFTALVRSGMTLYAAWNEIDIPKQQIILTIGEKTASVFGETKSNDVAPVIVNDRAMLPARFVAENLGAVVAWDNTAPGIVKITKGDIEIVIYIGEDYALVNGEKVTLDSPAFIENDRTYTPLRFIAESLGANVTWEPDGQKVIITAK